MSERLDARAEVLKLARLLTVEDSELEFLGELPPNALRQYREAATERLFDADAATFRRVGSAARLVPSPIVASIAQRAFGPLLCARAAGCVDEGKALDVLRRLPAEFVAEATVEVDPRRVAGLIPKVPQELVVPVARLLGEREEYVTMGRFLAYVPDHVITAAIGALSDEAMLRTAFVLEHKDSLDHAVGLLPPARLPGIIASASDLGLWAEALDLLDHLSEERLGPIAETVAAQNEAAIGKLVSAVSAGGLWDSLLPVVRLMSEDSLTRLVEVPVFHDPAILAEIIDSAATSSSGLWQDLAPLIDALPAEVHLQAAEIASRLPADRLAAILRDAVDAPKALPPLGSLVGAMDEEGKRKVGKAVQAVAEDDPGVLRAIIEAAARDGFWAQLAPLLAQLPHATQTAVAGVAAALEDDQLAHIVRDAADAPEALPPLVAILELMPSSGQARVAAVIESAPQTVVRDLLDGLESRPSSQPDRQLPEVISDAASRALASVEEA